MVIFEATKKKSIKTALICTDVLTTEEGFGSNPLK